MSINKIIKPFIEGDKKVTTGNRRLPVEISQIGQRRIPISEGLIVNQTRESDTILPLEALEKAKTSNLIEFNLLEDTRFSTDKNAPLIVPLESTQLFADLQKVPRFYFEDPKRQGTSQLDLSYELMSASLSRNILRRPLSDIDEMSPQEISEKRKELNIQKYIPLKQLVAFISTVKSTKDEKLKSKYKEFCDYMAFNNEMFKKMVKDFDVKPVDLEHYIHSQSEQKYRSTVELISNAIDATYKKHKKENLAATFKKSQVRVVLRNDGYTVADMGIGMDSKTILEKLLIPNVSGSGEGTIGRFGVGFYTSLSHLESPDDEVLVRTNDGNNAYRISFKINPLYNDIGVNIEPINLEEAKTSGQNIPLGTAITVKSKNFEKEKARELIDYSFAFNDKQCDILLRDQENQHDYYLVNDLNNLNKISGENTSILFSKEQNLKNESHVSILVNGVTIESQTIKGANLPKDLVLDFPLECSLPENRAELSIDKVAIDSIKEMVSLILGSAEVQDQEKISICNALYLVIGKMQDKNCSQRKKDNIEIFFQEKFNKFANKISLNSKLLIPDEAKYLGLDIKDPWYINPNLLGGNIDLGNLLAFSKEVKNFRSKDGNRLYLIDFKDHAESILIQEGNVLLYDKKSFENDDLHILTNLYLSDLSYGKHHSEKPRGFVYSEDEFISEESLTKTNSIISKKNTNTDNQENISDQEKSFNNILSLYGDRIARLETAMPYIRDFLGLLCIEDDIEEFSFRSREQRMSEIFDAVLEEAELRPKRLMVLYNSVLNSKYSNQLFSRQELLDFLVIDYGRRSLEVKKLSGQVKKSIKQYFSTVQKSGTGEGSVLGLGTTDSTAKELGTKIQKGSSLNLSPEELECLKKSSELLKKSKRTGDDTIAIFRPAPINSRFGGFKGSSNISANNRVAAENHMREDNERRFKEAKIYVERIDNFTNKQLAGFISFYNDFNSIPVIKNLFKELDLTPRYRKGFSEYQDSLLNVDYQSINKISEKKVEILTQFITSNKKIFLYEPQLVFLLPRVMGLSEQFLDLALKLILKSTKSLAIINDRENFYNFVGSNNFQYLCDSFQEVNFDRLYDCLKLIIDKFPDSQFDDQKIQRLIKVFAKKISHMRADDYSQITDVLGRILQARKVRGEDTVATKRLCDKYPKVRPYAMYIIEGGELLDINKNSENNIKLNNYNVSFKLSELYQAQRLKENDVASFGGDENDLYNFIDQEVISKNFDLEEVERDIAHAINNQIVNDDYLWIREMVQNSVDELIRAGVLGGDVSLETYLEPDSQDMVISINDSIGMDLNKVVNYLLIPHKSDKKDIEELIGKFGQGFFTIFKGSKEVRIKTSTGNGLVTYLSLKPIKDSVSGKVYDLDIRVTQVAGEEFKGSKIQKVVGAEIPELEAAFCKNSMFRNTGLVDARKVKVFYNKSQINKERKILAQRHIPELEGDVLIYEAGEKALTQNGLYIKDLDDRYFAMMPQSISSLLQEAGIVIDLPPKVKLIKSRNNIAKEDDVLKILANYIPEMSMKIFLDKLKAGNIAVEQIPNLPYDFFNLSRAGRFTFLDKDILGDAIAISYGLPIVDYSRYITNSEDLMLLLSNIKFMDIKGEKLSLNEIVYEVSKEKRNFDLSLLPLQIQRILEKELEEAERFENLNRALLKSMDLKLKQGIAVQRFSDKYIVPFFTYDDLHPEYKEKLDKEAPIYAAFDSLRESILEKVRRGKTLRSYYYLLDTSEARASRIGSDIGWNMKYIGSTLALFKTALQDKASLNALRNFFKHFIGIETHEKVHNIEGSSSASHNDQFFASQRQLLRGLMREKQNYRSWLEEVRKQYPDAAAYQVNKNLEEEAVKFFSLIGIDLKQKIKETSMMIE